MNNNSDLSCTICFETYVQPMTLACNHSYCKPCITYNLFRNHKCPLCKYPVLGIFDLKINNELQKLVNEKTTSERRAIDNEATDIIEDSTTRTESNISSSNLRHNSNLVRCPAFEIINNKKYFFKNTLYRLEIMFGLPYDMIASVMLNNCFVGYVLESGKYRRRSNVFEIVNIINANNQRLDIIARCKDVIIIEELKSINLNENQEFAQYYRLTNLDDIYVTYARGIKFVLSQDDITPEDKEKLSFINIRLEHFIAVLKLKNPTLYEILKLRYNFAFIDTSIRYCYNENLPDYLSFCAALLNMSDKNIKTIYESNSAHQIINIIDAYLSQFEYTDDPTKIFSPLKASKSRKQWIFIILLIAMTILVKLLSR